MKAAVCRQFGHPLVIEDVSLADPEAGEVRVRLAACAICHSDILFADGGWGGTLPAVYGHEASGIVETIGEGVQNVRPGDHVVVTLVRSCGQCSCCAQGYHGSCLKTFPLDDTSPLQAQDGTPVAHGLRTGAFAQYVVVESSQVVAIAKDIPFDVASLLACGVLTGFGAVTNSAKVRPGSSVIIIGTGGVGLNTVQAAALSGAALVIAVDVSETKLEAANLFGATHGINTATQDVSQTVKHLTNGHGADYVFVTVGAQQAFNQAPALVARGGKIILVGMPATGVMSQIDPGTIAGDSISIIGSKMGASNIHIDIPHLVEMYKAGRLKLDELITARYPLEEINEAIAEVKQGNALRNVIVF